MGLLSGPAMRDQVRVVAAVESGAKVEGRRTTSQVASAWFAARLVLDAGQEEADTGGRRRAVDRGQVILREPESGAPRSSDQIEVRERAGDESLWQVNGQIQRIVTRRHGVSLVVPVRRMSEPGAVESV